MRTNFLILYRLRARNDGTTDAGSVITSRANGPAGSAPLERRCRRAGRGSCQRGAAYGPDLATVAGSRAPGAAVTHPSSSMGRTAGSAGEKEREGQRRGLGQLAARALGSSSSRSTRRTEARYAGRRWTGTRDRWAARRAWRISRRVFPRVRAWETIPRAP